MIKEVSTREQVHIIQNSWGVFRKLSAVSNTHGSAPSTTDRPTRMSGEVGKSAKKIGENFDIIEWAELDEPEALAPGIDHET